MLSRPLPQVLLLTACQAGLTNQEHNMLCRAMLCCVRLCYLVMCCALPWYAMPCRAMPCHARSCLVMLCHAVPRCATLCHAVPCFATLCYAAGERRQALEAFVAAFGVEASGVPATSNSRADPVLQVSVQSQQQHIAAECYLC